MSTKRILIIEDEKDIVGLVEYNLSREGYIVSSAPSGEDGLRAIRREPPDLIILDLMLPGIDGLSLCKLLKKDEKYLNIPIVILSAKGDESDVVAGLELGADDYITKPFSVKVLLARVRAVLRKRESGGEEKNKIIKVHEINIDPLQYKVSVGNKPVELTATEFNTLYFLAGHPGRVYTRSQIIDNVKGEFYPSTDRAVDVQIVSLRKKLGKAEKYIETVRGIGYRFKE